MKLCSQRLTSDMQRLIDLSNHLLDRSKTLSNEKEEKDTKNDMLSNENSTIKQQLGKLTRISQ
jgi:hypothetical protein